MSQLFILDPHGATRVVNYDVYDVARTIPLEFRLSNE